MYFSNAKKKQRQFKEFIKHNNMTVPGDFLLAFVVVAVIKKRIDECFGLSSHLLATAISRCFEGLGGLPCS